MIDIENPDAAQWISLEEAGGDVLTAKKLAGYSDTTSTSHVVNSLKEEIIESPKTKIRSISKIF